MNTTLACGVAVASLSGQIVGDQLAKGLAAYPATREAVERALSRRQGVSSPP
jgi:hypothetical protein